MANEPPSICLETSHTIQDAETSKAEVSAGLQAGELFDVQSLTVAVLRGREEILSLAPVLEQVAEGFGQYGAMNWLQYFWSGASVRARTPWLVLLLTPDAAGPLNRNSIAGCALFSEYVLLGRGTGAMVTEDPSGFRTVLAPAAYRFQVAERCAVELLNRGAQIVLVSYTGQPENGVVPITQVECRWASRSRSVGSHLELLPTFAATLARFDKPVRRRLVYFRSRLQRTTACIFVPDVTTELSEAQFQALNRGALNVVTDEEAAQRWRACQLPGGYAMGLRTESGHWLGILGGWRQCDTTVLHWQQNSAGWEKHSLGTVLRSYFLEHETQIGMRRIAFINGTTHSIRHYFPKATVTDLILLRTTLHTRILLKVMGRRRNFLADTLRDPDLQWSPTARIATGKSRQWFTRRAET